jgi:hypothetical protein
MRVNVRSPEKCRTLPDEVGFNLLAWRKSHFEPQMRIRIRFPQDNRKSYVFVNFRGKYCQTANPTAISHNMSGRVSSGAMTETSM